MEVYYTHNNREKEFKVVKEGSNMAYIFKNDRLIKKYKFKSFFVGKSPLNKQTEFSKSYGPEFDGNSILLWISGDSYVFIGSVIMSFKSDPIIQFVSPVGNNDVPYPYAIDNQENYILFMGEVIVNKVPREFANDPYDYFYSNNRILKENAQLFVGTESFVIRYKSNPAKTYDRLIKQSNDKKLGMYILVDGAKKKIKKSDYIAMNTVFGKKHGFKKIKSLKVISFMKKP